MEYAPFDGLMLPIWESFNAEAILPELLRLYNNGRSFADRLAAMDAPTFADIISDEDNKAAIARIMVPLQHLFMTMAKKYPDIKNTVDAANRLEVEYNADIASHTGLYRAYQKVCVRDDFASLTTEQQYIIQQAIADFERAGVNLSVELQYELRGINQRLAELSTEFGNNLRISTDAWSLFVSPSNLKLLKGIPESVQTSMKVAAQECGKIGALITLGMSDTLAVLQYANNRMLRQEVWTARNARASSLSVVTPEADNGPLMPYILTLRQRKAEILGFRTFNELSLSTKAARAVGIDGVEDFLCIVADAAQPFAQKDFARWQEKGAELGIAEIKPWDYAYISRIISQERSNLDIETVREYFPLEKVLAVLSNILYDWWGISLVKIDSASVWHESVTFLAVKNKEGETVGGLYMDLFERAGKNGGAWMHDATARRKTSDGIQLPVAYLVGNFRKPADGTAYLSHAEIVTLFHEIGHCFHLLMTETNYIATNMSAVEWDTIDLPSHFFENWCWEPDTLKRMSSHRESGEPIPDKLLNVLIAERTWEAGDVVAGQVLRGLFDLLAHRYVLNSEADIIEFFALLSKKITLLPAVRPEVRFPHTFSHIFVGGYAAGYFSYLWAKGLVADVYDTFKAAGGMHDAATAERYREQILSKGASRPMVESIRAFLGRDPDPTKLIPYLGLEE